MDQHKRFVNQIVLHRRKLSVGEIEPTLVGDIILVVTEKFDFNYGDELIIVSGFLNFLTTGIVMQG